MDRRVVIWGRVAIAVAATFFAWAPQGFAQPVRIGPAVGVMLPLTGQYSSFGNACLRGIQLALGATGGRPPVVRTVVRDTGGDSAEASRVYRFLADDAGIAAILGPMLSWELVAIERHVANAGLPVLSFSQRATRPDVPTFRFSMSREDQAGVVAWYGVRDRELTRWAILYPNDSYGSELADAFRREVHALGGEVVASVGYDKDKTDFQEEVGRLQSRVGRWTEAEEEEDRELELFIDGVFLPDSADRMALIAPHLAFFDIRGVQLLGTSGWNDAEALRRAGRYVEGAVFVDGFFAYSPQPAVQQFVDTYRDAYGSNPGILEAYGYDAAQAVLDSMRRGADTREGMERALRRSLIREGATGWTEQNGGTAFRKHLFLLSYRDGTIREIERVRPAGVSARSEPLRLDSPWREPVFDSREDASGTRER